MEKRKTITIVSYFDDNFGDMLIKNSFECLLKTALENLGIENYNTVRMPLRKIDHELLQQSNLICFAGGGLLGLSYLGFFEYVKEIVEYADANGIPLIFSSVGINNMDYEEGDDTELRNLLSHRCIKAISVREQIEWFRKYSEGNSFSVEQVCDPAMWTRHMFKNSLPEKHSNKPLVGINMVRGKLLRANGYEWTQKDQFEYVDKIIDLLNRNSYDYVLYTNGSTQDDLALRKYAESRNIANEKVEYVHNSAKLVETISSCDFVCAIRLHSAIIATSFGIPVANLVWNDKVPCFYEAVGHPDRVFSIESLNYDKYEEIIRNNISVLSEPPEEYLMSLYEYIYRSLSKIFKVENPAPIYSFTKISDLVAQYYEKCASCYCLEDYAFKVDKAERNAYTSRGKAEEIAKQLKAQEKENKKLSAELHELKTMPVVRAALKIKRFKKESK